MRIVDEVILQAVRDAGVDVKDGQFLAPPVPGVPTKVYVPLPYAVYASSIGDDHNPRLDGRRRRRSVFFSWMYVGLDRNQTKACGERVRQAIDGVRFVIPGHNTWPVQLLESQRVRRDDDAIRQDGKPLFYGVDNYDLALTFNNQPVGAAP